MSITTTRAGSPTRGQNRCSRSKMRRRGSRTIPKSKPRSNTASSTTPSARARPGARSHEKSHRTAGRRLACQFHAVESGDHLDLLAASADPLEPHRFGELVLDHPVVQKRFMVEQDEPLYLRRLRELDPDHTARMAPILLNRDRVPERIHRVENEQIRVSVEIKKGIGFVQLRIFVLAVSRIDDRLAAAGKAISVRISAVKLLYRTHPEAGDVICSTGFESDELDRRCQRLKIDRETRSGVLRAQRIT